MIEIPRFIELARDGDVHAYGQVVRHLQNAAIGYAYSRLGDFHLAEDVSQEAFLDAHANLDQLRDPAAFPGWIRRILATRCARLRHRSEVTTVDLDWGLEVADPAPSPEERALAVESTDRTARALESLSSQHRDVVALFYYGGMAQRDIAAFLDIPVHTVKNRLFTARKQLKEMIDMVENDSEEQRHARGHRLAGRVIGDVWQRHALSTVVGTLHAALATVTDAWPAWRLAGVLGHAFTFGVNTDGRRVNQVANLDWQLFFARLGALDRDVRVFEGSLNGANRKFPRAMAALKQEAWEAVRASIEKGVPAIAWQPMTVEQRRDGAAAYEWQLLVGCDPRERTYTVRLGRDDEHRVGYDRFGYTDPVQWFCVLVIGDERPTDRRAVEIESIRQAVAMAQARDAANESLPNPLGARGLAAYDLWRTILEGDADTAAADRARAYFLSRSRDLPARYLADLAERHAEVPALKRAARGPRR